MRLFVHLALAVGLGLATAGSAAYLPTAGPAPLHFFRAPPRVATMVMVLPVPAAQPDSASSATDAAPMGTNTLASAIGRTNTPAADAITITVGSPPTSDDTSGQPPVPVGSLPDEAESSMPDPLTPQMLLHFFQNVLPGAGRRPAGVAVPLQFVPPVPLTSPPSKATWTMAEPD